MTDFEQVADGVLVATHPFCTTTTTVVIGTGNECLIVDPAVTPDQIAVLAADLDRRGLRVVAGFSTHPHWDHLLWHDALGEAPRYATATAAQTAARHRDDLVAAAAGPAPGHDPGVLSHLTALESGATRLPWEGRAVHVIEHRAHAPGHAALLIPDVGVLIAGDMLSDVEIPLPDHDATSPLADYSAALDVLGAAGATTVIPGHGAVGDATELRRRLDLDRAYIDAVAGGHEVDDPRLVAAEEWIRREHAATAAVAGEAGTAPTAGTAPAASD